MHSALIALYLQIIFCSIELEVTINRLANAAYQITNRSFQAIQAYVVTRESLFLNRYYLKLFDWVGGYGYLYSLFPSDVLCDVMSVRQKLLCWEFVRSCSICERAGSTRRKYFAFKNINKNWSCLISDVSY